MTSPTPRRCNLGVIGSATYPRQAKAVPDWFPLTPLKTPSRSTRLPALLPETLVLERLLRKPLTRLELVTSPLPRGFASPEIHCKSAVPVLCERPGSRLVPVSPRNCKFLKTRETGFSEISLVQGLLKIPLICHFNSSLKRSAWSKC